MLIKSNKSPKEIVGVWHLTTAVFKKRNIPLVDEPLEKLVNADMLPFVLRDLNKVARIQKTRSNNVALFIGIARFFSEINIVYCLETVV
ncbi:hypothetical protein [Bacillus sp. V5-8f]|uniref:hypothetical protein n=1 Tax=Bacillus sp. V5-8f TaxID=2053044 RepID=UPI000C770EC9|nr:hypothetical protein [Bacillus sp. V5-8f]PLT32051.1 hypothetical protein CUU64_20995 [Bacillus sp. V5-8f]